MVRSVRRRFVLVALVGVPGGQQMRPGGGAHGDAGRGPGARPRARLRPLPRDLPTRTGRRRPPGRRAALRPLETPTPPRTSPSSAVSALSPRLLFFFLVCNRFLGSDCVSLGFTEMYSFTTRTQLSSFSPLTRKWKMANRHSTAYA